MEVLHNQDSRSVASQSANTSRNARDDGSWQTGIYLVRGTLHSILPGERSGASPTQVGPGSVMLPIDWSERRGSPISRTNVECRMVRPMYIHTTGSKFDISRDPTPDFECLADSAVSRGFGTRFLPLPMPVPVPMPISAHSTLDPSYPTPNATMTGGYT